MAEQAILGDAALTSLKTSDAATRGQEVKILASQHMRMVFRICWSILRNHHDAEDAVQECFLRVLKFQDRIHEVRNPKTWLAALPGPPLSTSVRASLWMRDLRQKKTCWSRTAWKVFQIRRFHWNNWLQDGNCKRFWSG